MGEITTLSHRKQSFFHATKRGRERFNLSQDDVAVLNQELRRHVRSFSKQRTGKPAFYGEQFRIVRGMKQNHDRQEFSVFMGEESLTVIYDYRLKACVTLLRGQSYPMQNKYKRKESPNA